VLTDFAFSHEEAEEMSSRKKVFAVTFAVLLCAALLWSAQTKKELAKQLWPKARVMKALKDVEKQKADGMITQKMYLRKKMMLRARLKGMFSPTMLSTTNPPLNLLRNGSFEDFNPNTKKNMSRWNWWGGWAWPQTAEYRNDKESRPQYVKGGKLSARFQCTGKPARTGINQGIPTIEGATGYELTIWAKGEGENRLQISFESGVRGTFTGTIAPQWQKITVTGKPQGNTKKFTLYIYSRGGGTVWVDEARLLPLGVKLED